MERDARAIIRARWRTKSHCEPIGPSRVRKRYLLDIDHAASQWLARAWKSAAMEILARISLTCHGSERILAPRGGVRSTQYHRDLRARSRVRRSCMASRYLRVSECGLERLAPDTPIKLNLTIHRHRSAAMPRSGDTGRATPGGYCWRDEDLLVERSPRGYGSRMV